LNDDEVKKRQARDGPNKLPDKKKVPEIVKFVLEITNVFSLLLWAAALLSFIGYALDTSDPSNVYIK
jgi:magnesium-transporting ATPase (P-type)